MMIQPVRNYACALNTNPTRQLPPQPETVGELLQRTEADKRLLDTAALSSPLCTRAPGGGISNTLVTPEASANWKPAEEVRIQEFTAEESALDPSRFKDCALNGNVEDYFFVMDTRFIARQAETILAGGEFNHDDLITEFFSSGLRDWFGETGQNGMYMDSLKAVVQEYADRVKTGGSLDLYSLETKFTIRGEDVTFGQILDMRDAAKVLSGKQVKFDTIDNVSAGTDMYSTAAKKGVLKAAAQAYAKTLPGALGQAFSDNFARLYDRNMQACRDLWKDARFPTPSRYQAYHNWVADAADYSYDLFSDLDFSSQSTAQADFQRKRNLFGQMMGLGGVGIYANDFKADITKVFQDVCDAIF